MKKIPSNYEEAEKAFSLWLKNTISGAELYSESEEPEVKSITVSCNVKALRKLDRSGAVETVEPVSNLDFGDANSGSFIVTSEDPIKSYTVNGVQIEPTEPVKEFRILNVTSSLTLRLKVNRATAASAQVDESHMCKVTCKGCTFSYLRGGIRGALEYRRRGRDCDAARLPA